MDDNESYVRRIFTAVNQIDGVYYMVAKKMKTKESTLALMYALSDGQMHSQKQICDEWLIPKTTINTVVKQCMDAGYMELSVEPHSKQKLMRLTKQGKDYTSQLLEQMRQSENAAIERTLQLVSPAFIHGIEQFASLLHEEFNNRIFNETLKE